MAEDLVRVKKLKGQIRKNVKRLSVKQRAKRIEMRDKKEVAQFLMPDAPAKKKRISSPTRIECPLLPGTPITPPPRVRQPWELKKRESAISANGSSKRDLTVDLMGPKNSSSPRKKSKPINFTPSTDIIPIKVDISECDIVVADIQLIGFSPSSSSSDVACLLPEPAPSTSAEQTLSIYDGPECEYGPSADVDSDIDEDDPELITGTTRHRNVAEFNLEELPADEISTLIDLDRRDDGALRSLANDDMLCFNWSSDPATFTGVREKFTGQPGPTFSTKGMTPFDVFQKFWDSEIMETIAKHTNEYGHELSMDPTLSRASNFKKWTPVTVTELWNFFSILMLQSMAMIPIEKEYWYPSIPDLQIGQFSTIMSFHRFKILKRCLHFTNRSSQVDKSKLRKIRPVIDHLNTKFSCLYLPEQNIAIDESLLLWKGRLSFAQLIANKVARVGIKSYELCESRTGYLWKMIIYSGKDEGITHEATEPEPEGATAKIVHNLIRPLLNKGHTLVMDNFYNSPLLSRTLKAKKTDTMGTLRLNREFVPDSLRGKNKYNMRPGEVAFSQTQDLTIVTWNDSNVVSLISTFHKVEVGGQEKFGYFKYKPRVVLDYNLSMGGIDKKDQLLSAFPMERVRNQVWYKKLFRRLLNVSIHNSFIIFTNAPAVNMAQRQFRTLLVEEILKKFRPPKIQAPTGVGHFPARNGQKKGRCKWCARRKVDTATVWMCDTCHVNLCLIGCFREYHSQAERM